MSRLFKPFRTHRNWVLLASFVFFGALAAAKIATYQYHQEMIELFTPFFAQLEGLGETVFDPERPLRGAWFLLRNNLTASLTMMLTGPLIVLPFFGLLLNGGGIGVLAAMLFIDGVITPFTFYVRGILPHGLFEVPALLLAGAIGLRTSAQLLRPPAGTTRLPALRDNYIHALRATPVLVVLLIIAALVEVFITPQLLMF